MKMQSRLFYATLLLLLIATAVAYSARFPISKPQHSSPLLVKNFVDLKKIEKISKFRSCQGHTVVPVGESESRRNMKHYFVVKPEYRKSGAVPLYAPYSARIAGIRAEPEKGLEGEIWLDGKNEWQFSIEHIQLLDSLKENNKVKAGDLLGYSSGNGFDIVYAIGADSPKVIDGYTSPFTALDTVFAQHV